MTNLLSTLSSPKITDRSEAKSEAKLRVKRSLIILIFDTKLRTAVLASLRSAIFRGIKVDRKLVTSLVSKPAGVDDFF